MGTKLYGLQLGRFGMDMETLLPGHPDFAASPTHKDRDKAWYQCPSLAYVVEHPEGRILFDTGVSPRWREEWPDEYKIMDWEEIRPEDLLEPRLKSIGLGPEDFDFVVMGHLHADHAGGLRIFENAGAEIVVHEDELKGVLSLEEDANFMSRADYEFLPRKKPTLVYGDQQLLKGVRLISLPGHTWGTMGMLVHLDRTGWVLCTSDAMLHHKTYGPPPVGNLYSISQEKWGRSIEKIRRYATKYEAIVAPGHSETGIKHHAGGATDLVELGYYPGQVYE